MLKGEFRYIIEFKWQHRITLNLNTLTAPRLNSRVTQTHAFTPNLTLKIYLGLNINEMTGAFDGGSQKAYQHFDALVCSFIFVKFLKLNVN